ncbi:MAG: type IX secretion system membrane protein PorP/SprF [Bacteroidetes bacterium]|jgi:type IX secretion system PorP/SprF family membrane protein|nr:type IX secretion system membrane protein PorP/SprF [Bacteroidota bacterium]
MKKYALIALLALGACMLGSENVQGQDPQFTQFYANPLYLNPAFAGTARCPRFVMSYRNQWPSLPGSFVTYSASYDQHVSAISGGIGFIAMRDEAGQGVLSTTGFSGIYSYQRAVSRKFSLKFGLQASYTQKALDWSRLTFGDQIDSRRGFIFQTQETERGGSVGFFDASAGILGFSDDFYFGGAVHHINEPNESLILGVSRLPMKFTGHAGAVLPIDGKSRSQSEATISPNILFQRQADFQQINLGVYLTKGPLVVGTWYRFEDSFIALLGVQTDLFKVGYSYDLTTSQLTTQTGGSHEVSLTFQMQCRDRRGRFRTISCPSF